MSIRAWRPYRVYKRELADVRFFGAFHTFEDAERAARTIGGYVTARKDVWHDEGTCLALEVSSEAEKRHAS